MTQKEMLMNIMNTMGTINQRLDGIESRVASLEKSKKTQNPTTVGKSKPQPKKEKDERTFREKKAEWAANKYSEAERKAYGEKKKAEREKQHKAYEMANASFKEKVDYKVWKAKYNEILATL